jgi:hypothetical protein
MIITRGFSLTNFIIGSSALGFQVLVLYPWHEQLDRDFEDLKAEHLRVLYKGESDRTRELLGIREELEKLNERQKSWAWR